MNLFIVRRSRSQEAELSTRDRSPSPARRPAVCRSELARDPQGRCRAQAAVACKQAPTKNAIGPIQFLQELLARRARLSNSTLLGLALALLASAASATNICTPEEQALLTELEVSIAVDADLPAAASAAPDASDTRDVGSAGGDTPAEARALLGLGCLDEVLGRFLGGEAAALELLSYFEPKAAARQTLKRLLKGKERNAFDALLSALVVFGPGTVEAVLQASDCHDTCESTSFFKLAAVLEQLGPERRAAAQLLTQRAGRTTLGNDTELGLIRMIMALGSDAAPAELELIALLSAKPERSHQILAVLAGLGTPTATQAVISRLDGWSYGWLIKQLARAGHQAKAAIPKLLELTESSEQDLALLSITVLGYITPPEEASPVREHLHRWLADGSDALRAMHAADALGVMRDLASQQQLRVAADEYWYPPVREAASRALALLPTPMDPPPRASDTDHADGLIRLPDDLHACETPTARAVDQAQGEKLYQRTHRAQLQKLSYRGDLVEEYLPPPPPPPGVNPDWRPSPHPVEVPQHTPDLALRVAGGWLLGANRGEWDGELIFAADDGRRQGVLGRNVEDIYRLGPQVIALVGLAHMGSNEGVVYRLRQAGSGEWTAEPWLQLPGAPYSSWPVDTGEILVNTHGGGTILIAADGSMRMAPCLDPPPIEETRQR